MEVKQEFQREYNPAHPNFERWQKARDLSKERAEFVRSLISNTLTLEKLLILDFGAGEGSTSELLSQNNFVVSLEPKAERIKKIPVIDTLNPIMADSLNLPFKNSVFDIIILQDVLEHLSLTEKLINELQNILRKDGIIYLSTPNRFSFFNIISDPHWGMPFLCLFKRKQIKKFFLKYFRKSDYNRNDIAELLSLNDLLILFDHNFSISLNTKYSTEFLLNGGKGLVWSRFHLLLINYLRVLGLAGIIKKIANDKYRFLNKYVTPTFYLILKKK